MVGKLLGETPQGTWMGVMFSLGAIARIAGPFWAVTGFYSARTAAPTLSTTPPHHFRNTRTSAPHPASAIPRLPECRCDQVPP